MNKGFTGFFDDTTLTFRVALRSSVAKNATSLYVIQFANFLFPLITIPYLVRVLSPSGYGIVIFCQSLIGYFAILVNYGFDLSATRKISTERDDPIALSRTVSTVWAAKFLLCAFGLIIFFLIATIIPKLHQVTLLLLVLYGIVIGNVLFPIWLFQGMERMVFISVINLPIRLLILIGIFTMVHHPEDYLLWAGLISLGSVAAGLAGVGIALFMFKLRPVFVSWREIWHALVEGWMLFLSTASISLYTVGNAFILGLLTNPTVVGYYSVAEKIVKAVIGLLSPIARAAYPRFSKLASESKMRALQWSRRMLVLMSSLGLFLSIALFAGAPIIVRIVIGSEYESCIKVMRLLAPLPLLIAASNVLGIQIMLPFGKDKEFTSILICAGFINIVFAILLAPLWKESGMAVAVLLSETFVTFAMFGLLWRFQLVPIRDDSVGGGIILNQKCRKDE